MDCDCLHDTVGCVAFYTCKPLLICRAILSTAWKAARMVHGLAAENAAYSAVHSSWPPPASSTFQPRSARPAARERPTSNYYHTLQQQLAQIETERTPQRWSSPPTYRLHDDNAPKPAPLNFSVSQKHSYGDLACEKEMRIAVYPVKEEPSPVDSVFPRSPVDSDFPRSPIETMRYVPMAT
ncbi:uncharacterized protein BKCO1_3300096 [Diplodia corticola]|uniref:Uncharacterized protein n=1 Tax=Diplodia corticola TaxID=236234 RepID=A0A1J9QYM5_9PEZI|nr:uncharacterized protein BKCO1_3300096 [Diplodia corticola]OJD33106.1 hypothetical protein BKCO1_3300096 [Diplodia corticola]